MHSFRGQLTDSTLTIDGEKQVDVQEIGNAAILNPNGFKSTVKVSATLERTPKVKWE